MKASRRGFFGALLGAPLAAKAAVKEPRKAALASPYIGQPIYGLAAWIPQEITFSDETVRCAQRELEKAAAQVRRDLNRRAFG